MIWTLVDRHRAASLELKLFDEHAENGVGEFERVFGMLRQRAGQIGRNDFHVQLNLSRGPLPPATECDKRHAGQCHESRGP